MKHEDAEGSEGLGGDVGLDIVGHHDRLLNCRWCTQGRRTGPGSERRMPSSTAAGHRSSPTTCFTPCCGAARAGESVEQIQPDLIIPTGKRKGQSPSVASIYRALAEHAKREAYPEAVEQAHADFATLTGPEVLEPRTETKALTTP
ncbi:hypothetical protein [Streptomyces sp. B1I3]|uniref:hypothetical protein n=1 Tax=Streptomyces sp. B1I3 TaxID=3042264 RepID=UPI00278990F6|nr:hypothetical protein [Streptomyces sp. B1I3]MDQ0798198.1 hypothetical protein [Streptomyces sp. B1I3]